MGLVGGGVLVVGMALIALFIFGPARKRLEARAGSDRAARRRRSRRRARPEGGGDEVAAVARSFNRMADELTDPRAGARRVGQGAAAAARRRVARADDAAHRDARLRRDAVDAGAAARRRDRASATWPSSRKRRTGSSASSATCSISRASKAAAGRCGARRSTSTWLFERVATRHERELRERRVTLVQHVAEGAAHVVGDPDRLEQALQNLAANALRHTPDGGQITLEASGGDGVRLRVRDTGPGIAPEHLPLIFDRFYKIDAARKASGGSGLGLSIVKAIVERHGGTIVAYNDSATAAAEAPSSRSSCLLRRTDESAPVTNLSRTGRSPVTHRRSNDTCHLPRCLEVIHDSTRGARAPRGPHDGVQQLRHVAGAATTDTFSGTVSPASSSLQTFACVGGRHRHRHRDVVDSTDHRRAGRGHAGQLDLLDGRRRHLYSRAEPLPGPWRRAERIARWCSTLEL